MTNRDMRNSHTLRRRVCDVCNHEVTADHGFGRVMIGQCDDCPICNRPAEPDPFAISPIGTIRGDDAVWPEPEPAEPRAHWHVANGTPGYLFDTEDPPTFATRAEATAYARAEAIDERDQRNEIWLWRRMATTPEDAQSAYERVPLAREDRYTADLRTGRTGEFAVSIDRPHYAYGLPYEWRGWSCTDNHDEEGN